MTCLKRSCILLVALLFLLSATPWAGVILTDDEWDELNLILTELDDLTTQQRAELIMLGRSLRVSESNLRIAKSELTDSLTAVAEARRLSQEAEKYSQEQMRVTVVIAILSGFAAGIFGLIIGAVSAR